MNDTAANDQAMALLHQGILLSAQGKKAEARDCFMQALAVKERFAEGYNALGVLCMADHNWSEAAGYFERAITFNLHYAEAHNNLGTSLLKQGILARAVVAYEYARRLLDHPSVRAHLIQALLGLAQHYRGQRKWHEVQRCYQRVLTLQPDEPQARCQLGLPLLQKCQWLEAERHYAAIYPQLAEQLAQNPSAQEIHRVGGELYYQGQIYEALLCYLRLINSRPHDTNVYINLALVLEQHDLFDEARACYEQALTIQNSAITQMYLGRLFHQKKMWPQAIACYEAALALEPTHAQTMRHLMQAYISQYQLEQAGACFEKFVRDHPDHKPDTESILLYHHVVRSGLLLVNEQFASGWFELVWVWYQREYRYMLFAGVEITQPPWDGSDLGGKRLLLTVSGNAAGDPIQFARYIPQVLSRGGTVMFACQDDILPLMKRIDGLELVVSRRQMLPHFDHYLPVTGLPWLLQHQTLADIPSQVPYLSVDPDVEQLWRERLWRYRRSDHLHVGLVWAGGTSNLWDGIRSIHHIEKWWPLFEVPKITFFSVQPEASARELRRFPPGRLIDLTADIKDFMDTAALITQLDLLISIDSSPAHLAGALGCPVWTLVAKPSDWRWLHEREDTPWYPSMRLFRQRQEGDWDEVMERIAAALVDHQQQITEGWNHGRVATDV
ncbi:MAG: tetratricopeptide repeat protein [Magnetococcales bacterium]|nr:tetratricopeptide repeat protein [Magnetococcales bacterium]